MTFWLIAAACYGLAIGSFLNVVIWRLPRGGSILSPTWSYCPRCEHRLGTWDLFPVLSFLALGAKCRYCREPISWRYPGIELLTGALFAAVAFYTWQQEGQWFDVVFRCLFTAVLICVFFIDLEHFLIPDGLNVIGVLLGLSYGLVAGRFWDSVLGLAVYAGLIYLIGLLSYVYLVSLADKRLPAGQAAGTYLRENVDDWAYVGLSSLAGGPAAPCAGRFTPGGVRTRRSKASPPRRSRRTRTRAAWAGAMESWRRLSAQTSA